MLDACMHMIVEASGKDRTNKTYEIIRQEAGDRLRAKLKAVPDTPPSLLDRVDKGEPVEWRYRTIFLTDANPPRHAFDVYTTNDPNGIVARCSTRKAAEAICEMVESYWELDAKVCALQDLMRTGNADVSTLLNRILSLTDLRAPGKSHRG